MYFLREAQKFKVADGVANGGVAADQFTNALGVDVIDLGEVEDDFFLALRDQAANCIAELPGFIAQSNASVNVDDRNVANFARGDGHENRFSVSAHCHGLPGNGRGRGFASQWSWKKMRRILPV